MSKEALQFAITAIESGETFQYLEEVVVPVLMKALHHQDLIDTTFCDIKELGGPWRCTCGSMNFDTRSECFNCGARK